MHRGSIYLVPMRERLSGCRGQPHAVGCSVEEDVEPARDAVDGAGAG